MNKTSPLPALHSARETVRARAARWLAPDGLFGRWFENLILALIVLSVASVILEETPGLPEWAKRAFHIEEIVVVVVFTFEYLLRLVAAKQVLAFVFLLPGPGGSDFHRAVLPRGC